MEGLTAQDKAAISVTLGSEEVAAESLEEPLPKEAEAFLNVAVKETKRKIQRILLTVDVDLTNSIDKSEPDETRVRSTLEKRLRKYTESGEDIVKLSKESTEFLTQPGPKPRLSAVMPPLNKDAAPFRAVTSLTGLGPLSEALLGRLPWSDLEVLNERDHILAMSQGEFTEHLRKFGKKAFGIALDAYRIVSDMEAQFYGDRSYFAYCERLRNNDTAQPMPAEPECLPQKSLDAYLKIKKQHPFSAGNDHEGMEESDQEEPDTEDGRPEAVISVGLSSTKDGEEFIVKKERER